MKLLTYSKNDAIIKIAESEVRKMANEKEILRKQLELLAKKSDECVALDDLILISNAMCNIANVLIAL